MYNTLWAGSDGLMEDYPSLSLAGRAGESWVEPREEEMFPLPEGATLTLVPGRHPVGLEQPSGRWRVLERAPGKRSGPAWAIAALLPQGFTRTLLPAFAVPGGASPLPLLGYTAVGAREGRLYVAALPTDEHRRWHPRFYNTPDLEDLVKRGQAERPHNRILVQLARCALEYGCFTAQNIFYRRWEGGLPFSPSCNARCLGCISLQPAECCPSPQGRISFRPTPEEVVEVALPHLDSGKEAMVSFGQGCEGEPLLRARTLAGAVRFIRSQTGRGSININTNAGYTAGVQLLVEAGADSFRVSMNSALPVNYTAYHRPRAFSLGEVANSLKLAAAAGVHTSLNWLFFPGVSDRLEEVEALVDLVEEYKIKQIQIRNLNIDPDLYCQALPSSRSRILGVPQALERLMSSLTGVTFGIYSRHHTEKAPGGLKRSKKPFQTPGGMVK